MPELKEVFEMVSQKVEPDADAWRQQDERHRRSARNRKIGAFAVVAAIAAVAIIAAVTLPRQEPRTDVGTNPPPTTLRPGVYLVDIATGETTLVPGIDPDGSSFDVSPDGTMVTFSASVASGEAVHVTDVDGSNVRALEQTAANGDAIGPRWSPDGSKIVYQGRGGGDDIGELFVVDVETGVTRRITDLSVVASGSYYMAPTFTADGESILFGMPGGTGMNERSNLWSVPATGGDPTLVRRKAGFADVSPDGNRIAYAGMPGPILSVEDFGDLFVAGVDGSEARGLADGPSVAPRWSPDGSMIAYQSGATSIRIVDVETGESSIVFDRAQFPAWVDDDTLIIDLTD